MYISCYMKTAKYNEVNPTFHSFWKQKFKWKNVIIEEEC